MEEPKKYMNVKIVQGVNKKQNVVQEQKQIEK